MASCMGAQEEVALILGYLLGPGGFSCRLSIAAHLLWESPRGASISFLLFLYLSDLHRLMNHWDLGKSQILIRQLWGLQGLRVCISNELPSSVDAAGRRPHFKRKSLEET